MKTQHHNNSQLTQFNSKIYILFYVLLNVFCLSCKQKGRPIDSKTSDHVSIPRDTLIKDMLKGDTIAYQRYMNDCYDFSFQDGLFWSIYFSDKYDYALASYNVYVCFSQPLSNGKDIFNDLSPETKNLALKYLRKAAQKNSDFQNDLKKVLMIYNDSVGVAR